MTEIEALSTQLARENERLANLLELVVSELIAIRERQDAVLHTLRRIEQNTGHHLR